MLKYILKRIGYSIITLWVLVTITFILMQFLPGDPFLGERAVPENIKAQLNAKYGLDQPLHIQYGRYMMNVLHGDFGDSMQYRNRAVNDVIKQAFPYSFDLGMRALFFSITFGMFLGIVAAMNHNKKWDKLSMIIAVVGVSVPSFIVGSLLQYFVALNLTNLIQKVFNTSWRLLPIGGWTSPAHKILPAFALGLSSLATIARLMRASMLDVVNTDYIKTARSKGLSEKVIVWKHCIRNAILPVVTIMGPLAAGILTGTFVLENIFNIPGLGRFFVQSVQMSDYTMITGLTLFYGAFLILSNMLVDIAYGLIDPRIRIAKGKR